MYKFAVDGTMVSINDLAEKNGIQPATLRYRIKQGYSLDEAVRESPVQDSVIDFVNASYYGDWVGKPIGKVYEIYWKWSMVNNYTPISKVAFGRQIKVLCPIKTVAGRDGRIVRLI